VNRNTKVTEQLELAFPARWGGRRAGAGRPPIGTRRNMPHRRRDSHRKQYPLLVTLRTLSCSLRSPFVFPTIRWAIAATNERHAECFRVCEFSVQGDHLHLLVEADSSRALSRGLRGLSVRISWSVNRLLFRKGRFIADRWHARSLTTPRAVRNALVYVLANFRKHQPTCPGALDLFSSAPYFIGFLELGGRSPLDFNPNLIPSVLAPPSRPPVAHPRTWLLQRGWLRWGRISVMERPQASPAPLTRKEIWTEAMT
jgi:putative transposase